MKFYQTLRWRIAVAYTVLIFLSLGVVSLYLVSFVHQSYVRNLQEELHKEAILLSDTVASGLSLPVDRASIQQMAHHIGGVTNARVTIIQVDGTVIADSWEDPKQMGNHSDRIEFQEALRSGLGTSTRVSATVHQELLYVAVPVGKEGTVVAVARVAVPTAQINANVNRIIAAVALSGLGVALLTVGLAFYVAQRTTRSVRAVTEGARRLARGDLEYRVRAVAMDETQELAAAFNSMASSLRDMIRNLSDEHGKLSAVLDTMADGVMVIDAQGKVELANQAATRFLDLSPTQVSGGTFMAVARDYELQQLVLACQRQGGQQRGEVETLYPRRSLSAIVTPLQDGGDKKVLLLLHDLTSFRQVETTRKEFVSNVSHELRTPLASVKAMVETLNDGALSDPEVAHDFLRRIDRDIDWMTGLVNDLLVLARLESGQTILNLAPTQLRSLVEEAISALQARAQSKGITLEVTLPADLPPLLGDADRLRQVVINLVENAIKFTSVQGKVSLKAQKEGDVVKVRVSDTGIGIAKEHLPHIFERFYKVDRARRDGGAGLGLAIVKHIVEAHGGQVTVESQEGQGSTFSFTIPLAK